MALDEDNLKIQRVKAGDEAKFKSSTPEPGELHLHLSNRNVSVGDGATKGGVALATETWVRMAIATAEKSGTMDGIPID